jgi:GTP-binding protein HflX
MVFNKIDAFSYTEKEEDDLSPIQKENLSIEDLKRTWMSKKGENCIFISAKDKTNIEEFKALLYNKAREIHTSRFPYNNFLYENYDEE